jgi:hypothetical protein
MDLMWDITVTVRNQSYLNQSKGRGMILALVSLQ